VFSPVSGADPNLSMQTRRGTGCYKVPSLKGVWYAACSATAAVRHDGKLV